jgi:diacylglycerol kinase (ATP)
MSAQPPASGPLQTFRYAFRGIATMLRTERNARIHAFATMLVVGFGFGLGVDRSEWIALVLAVALVWAAEGFNTAFESLCDVASPEYHPQVERAKDVAAGAVLLAAMGALAVALLIFGRRILLLLT